MPSKRNMYGFPPFPAPSKRAKIVGLSGILVMLVLLAVAPFTLSGCATKRAVDAQGNVVQLPATPYEQVMAYNAALAEGNRGVAQGVIDVQRAGFLTLAQANNVHEVQFKVAGLHKRLTKILEAGPDAAKGNATEIRSILTQVKDLSNALTTDTKYGVLQARSDTGAMQALRASIGTVYTMANSILTGLQEAHILQ
jgi:hypothetical protein